MAKRYKVKITVLRRLDPSEVFSISPVTPLQPLEKCHLFEEGKEYRIDEDLKMPQGFCTSAWNTLYCSLRMLSFGGKIPWYKEENVAINCCMDGLRPVIFKLERV